MSKVKNSVDRFNMAAKALKEQSVHRDIDIQLATQLRQITLIMEDMLLRIDNIYQESSKDLKGVVGTPLIDETFWSRIKTETDEEAKVQNLAYYERSVIGVSDIGEKMVDVTDESSDASQLLNHLRKLDQSFKETQGIWGTGYEFLSKEWQEKISFLKLNQNLSQELKKLKEQMGQAIRPLWRTSITHYQKKKQEPPYKIGEDGFLKKSE